MPRPARVDESSLFEEDRPLLQQRRAAELAATLPATLRLGTSSWSFPGWQGLVYGGRHPEPRLAREGLREYARSPLLRTVGLDRAFYRPMTIEQCRSLASQAGPGFRFLVKAYRGLTHRDAGSGEGGRFLDAGFACDEVLTPLREGFGGALGTVLLQFPQMRLAPSEAGIFRRRLDGFLAALPREVPLAVELRDAVLLDESVAACLAAHGVALGHAVHPSLPGLPEQRRRLGAAADAVAAPAVLRWLLRRGLGYEEARDRYAPFDRLAEPDGGSRGELSAWCLEMAAAGRETFVIANNKAEGSAPLTLFELARTIARASMPGDDALRPRSATPSADGP